jgi:predicted Rossmann fold nucleotide-binding protein DprA/Smf involved in DNA uptake
MQRNDLVAALADTLLVPYAAPGGKAWTSARNALARRQTVYTFAGEENSDLINSGAKPVEARATINAFDAGDSSQPLR